MTTQEASELLKKHNEWRRSGDGEMASPTEIGEAVDILLAFYEGTQQRVSPQDPAVLINQINAIDKDNPLLKEYREKIDKANRQYFNSTIPLK